LLSPVDIDATVWTSCC